MLTRGFRSILSFIHTFLRMEGARLLILHKRLAQRWFISLILAQNH